MRKTADSLRNFGVTAVPCDKPTREGLKRLAEQEGLPVSHYLREIVRRESEGKGLPMSFGIMPSSPVELTKGLKDTASLLYQVSAFLTGFLEPWSVFTDTATKEQYVADMVLRLNSLADMAKRAKEAKTEQRGLFQEAR